MTKTPTKIKKRLEYLRREIKAERISYREIAELQSLAKYIDNGDVELLQWAGVSEEEYNEKREESILENLRDGDDQPARNFLFAEVGKIIDASDNGKIALAQVVEQLHFVAKEGEKMIEQFQKKFLIIGSNNFWYSTENSRAEAKEKIKEIKSDYRDGKEEYADPESGARPEKPEEFYIFEAKE